MTLDEQMLDLAKRAKSASYELAKLSEDDRNRCLLAMADAIEQNTAIIKEANQKDLEFGRSIELSSAMLDRLELTPKRISGMAQGLREVAHLPDPTGKTITEKVLENGLKLEKVTCPLGVIVIIYESRPNVTADAAGLCFKSGSATILRGGKEAIHSNQAIAQIMMDAAAKSMTSFPADAVLVVPTTDRAAIPSLLSLTEYVDLCMPRGGEGLIRAVSECSRVPVIKHFTGVCHVYIHSKAGVEMATQVATNSKCQRPGVCNAIEALLIDKAKARDFLPAIAAALWEEGVELRCDPQSLQILQNIEHKNGLLKPAEEQDWGAEYLDLVLAVKIVDGVEEAVSHINAYGSGHSDSIVTTDAQIAEQFLNDVDSAAVYWNASTRFTDGAQFGMGAEIGISTDKIGARGPMGLEELTTYKWKVYGKGQIRE